MRKFRKNKRAVSPVLSTVMLVLIVVIGMSAIFAFFVDYVSTYQKGEGSAVLELLEIEDVQFIDNVTVYVWLYNYGEIDLEIDAVYVNGLNMTLTYFHTDWSLEPYDHKMFTVTLIEGWDPSRVGLYNFRFVTTRGSSVERGYYAPWS